MEHATRNYVTASVTAMIAATLLWNNHFLMMHSHGQGSYKKNSFSQTHQCLMFSFSKSTYKFFTV